MVTNFQKKTFVANVVIQPALFNDFPLDDKRSVVVLSLGFVSKGSCDFCSVL